MSNTAQLVLSLKENDQDFEWYPTTDEIIQTVTNDIKFDYKKVLDIGAGDGRVLESFRLNTEKKPNRYGKMNLYGIEKSSILKNSWPPDIIPIGSDFKMSTLIDKEVDVIFCNPPYSEYQEWTVKIINEAHALVAYLVIPERWQNNQAISQVLESRQAETEILGGFDFLSADRQARAKVNIVKINFGSKGYGGRYIKVDPFKKWFDEQFPQKEEIIESKDGEKNTVEKAKSSLVPGQNLIERLVELYNANLAEIQSTFEAISSVPPSILQSVGVERSNIMDAIKLRLQGLKNIYWKELFDGLDKITSRLTTDSRASFLEKISSRQSVDFTVNNVYSIVIWAIKNANNYIDSQMLGVHNKLFSREAVSMYKSTAKFEMDEWRYNNGYGQAFEKSARETGGYQLDYRFVQKNTYAIYNDSIWSTHGRDGLVKDAWNLLADISTIAQTLGFSPATKPSDFEWTAGSENTFFFDDGKEFMKVRAYKNGNIHFKFNQDFMRAFNIHVGTLRGWIKRPQDAAEEMSDVTLKQAQKAMSVDVHLSLTGQNIKLLTE